MEPSVIKRLIDGLIEAKAHLTNLSYMLDSDEMRQQAMFGEEQARIVLTECYKQIEKDT